ncbi:kelch-like protein 1 [Arctopsyche grandis]|uniref:kelch-like protein 1 n=1 Tax=Arctopsyche grandis TaxID=121162 RepID=UPI00406D87C6
MCDHSTTMFDDVEHAKRGFDIMYELMLQPSFCDVEVAVNSHSYPVHGIVMAAFSDYFKININQNCCTNQRTKVTINNVDWDAMKQIIEYCYTGKIELRTDTAEKIMNVAGVLQMPSLLNGCCEFLKNIIDNKNCIRIAKLANLYFCSDLKEMADEFLYNNFTEISKTDEFLQMDYAQLLEMLKSEDLNVSLEKCVFDGVKRWTEHDYANRKPHLYSLLELVKLPLLPAETLFDEADPMCDRKDPCFRLISQAIQWQTIPSRRAQLDSHRNTPRKLVNVALAVGDWNNNGPASSVQMYEPETKAWSPFMTLNTSLANFCTVVLNDEFIVLGGFENEQFFNSVDSYSIKNGAKTSLPPMREIRYRPAVAVIEGILYVAGGSIRQNVINSAEKYNPKTKEWSNVSPMPTARHEVGCVVFENEMFVIGGIFNSAYSFDAVEAYCPQKGKWRKCAPTTVKRGCPAVAVLGGFIYAVGGVQIGPNRANFLSAERYNPKLNTWTAIANISVARYASGMCSIGNSLILIGGSNGSATMTDCEQYDPSTDKWTPITSVGNRGHLSLIAIPKKRLNRIKPNSVIN